MISYRQADLLQTVKDQNPVGKLFVLVPSYGRNQSLPLITRYFTVGGKDFVSLQYENEDFDEEVGKLLGVRDGKAIFWNPKVPNLIGEEVIIGSEHMGQLISIDMGIAVTQKKTFPLEKYQLVAAKPGLMLR
jgi:hypothetical protein